MLLTKTSDIHESDPIVPVARKNGMANTIVFADFRIPPGLNEIVALLGCYAA